MCFREEIGYQDVVKQAAHLVFGQTCKKREVLDENVDEDLHGSIFQ